MNTWTATYHVKVTQSDWQLCTDHLLSQELRNSVFLQEWPVFLESFTTMQLDTIILGDINLHLDDSKDTNAASFITTLQAHGMTQHVSGPTHIKGTHWTLS